MPVRSVALLREREGVERRAAAHHDVLTAVELVGDRRRADAADARVKAIDVHDHAMPMGLLESLARDGLSDLSGIGDGVVILDAIVDDRGRIQSLKVLRGHPLLAKAAIDAVQQWEYEPLKLNGTATPFELTVSLWFHFEEKPKRRS